MTLRTRSTRLTGRGGDDVPIGRAPCHFEQVGDQRAEGRADWRSIVSRVRRANAGSIVPSASIARTPSSANPRRLVIGVFSSCAAIGQELLAHPDRRLGLGAGRPLGGVQVGVVDREGGPQREILRQRQILRTVATIAPPVDAGQRPSV